MCLSTSVITLFGNVRQTCPAEEVIAKQRPRENHYKSVRAEADLLFAQNLTLSAKMSAPPRPSLFAEY